MTDAGKAAMKKNNLDATQVINFMNTTFQALGIAVRYQLVSGAEDVSMLQYMDKTDAVSVWGTDHDDINNYTMKNIPTVVGDISTAMLTLHDEEFDKKNPEISEVTGDFSAVSVDNSLKLGAGFGLNKEQSLGFVTMHGTTHNAGNSAGHCSLQGTPYDGLAEGGASLISRVDPKLKNIYPRYAPYKQGVSAEQDKSFLGGEANGMAVWFFNTSGKHFNTNEAKDRRKLNKANADMRTSALKTLRRGYDFWHAALIEELRKTAE
jgi:hypothetical protein